MDEREARLPGWARHIINDLRTHLQASSERLLKELTTLRPQVQLLKAKNEALTELLDCAARGGHQTAQAIMEVLRSFDLTLTKHDEGD